MAKFDRDKFNSDPKHEEERNAFDAMVEDSFNRIAKKKEKEAPPEPQKEKSFFDDLIDGILGK